MSSDKLLRIQNKIANMPDVTSAKATPPVIQGYTTSNPAPSVATAVSTPQTPPVIQGYTASNPAPTATQSTPAAPTTNYGGTGNPLNEILYSKRQYDAGNKGWAANNAKSYYSQLSTQEADAVSKMNSAQLEAYINSKNTTPSSPGTSTSTAQVDNPVFTMSTPGFVPAAPAQAPDYSQLSDTIRSSYMRDIESQTQAINQALAQAIQASELSVNKNNQQLQEQIRALTNQKAQMDDAAQQLQNRRGGFYSGGLDYQLGNIASTTQQATSDAQRDVAARNADIYSRNSLLAQQAAEQIKTLQNAAPDRIRELIRQAINDERSFGLQEGSLTGSYNGTPTLAAQQFQWGQQVDAAGLTGMFNGQQTRSAYENDRNFNYQVGQDRINNDAQYGGVYNGNKTAAQQQQEWANRFSYGQAIGQFGNGQQTLESRNQAFNQNMANRQQSFAEYQQGWQNKFQSEQFAYQKARDSITDNQWRAQFDESARRYGLDYAMQQLQQTNENAYRNATLAINQDENSRAWLNYENDLYSQGASAEYSGMSPNQVYDAVRSRFTDPNTEKLLNDAQSKEKMYQQVMASGLPDGQDTQVMALLGLTPAEISAYDKKYLGNP